MPPWSLDQHAEDVLETIEDEPIDVIGYSFGGAVAVRLDPSSARKPSLKHERKLPTA